MTDAFAKAAERAQQADPRLAQELADVSREVASYNDRATERELQELGDAIQERGQRIQAQQQLEQQADQLRAGAGGEESGGQQGDAQQQTRGHSKRSTRRPLQSSQGRPSSRTLGNSRGRRAVQARAAAIAARSHSAREAEAPRLQIEQKPSVVLADRGVAVPLVAATRAGGSPGPGTAPAQFGVTDAGNAIVSTGGASHFVPWMVADYVQQYFNALSNALEQSP